MRGPRSASPPRREAVLNRHRRFPRHDLRGPGPIEDDEPAGPGEAIVVRGNFLEEGELLEPDPDWTALDTLQPQVRRDAEEEREVGLERPFLAGLLQKSDWVLDDPFETGPLVCVRRIRVAVTEDEFTVLEVGADLVHVCGAVREEKKRLRHGTDIVIVGSSHRVAEPRLRRFAREEDRMTLRPKEFRHESADRRLPRTVDSLEGHETREHVRRQQAESTLNRRPVRCRPTAQRFYRVRRLRAAAGFALGGAGRISWKIRPDTRRTSDGGDREARCRKCHTRIVLLPEDRRQGYCFDCFDVLEVHSQAAF